MDASSTDTWSPTTPPLVTPSAPPQGQINAVGSQTSEYDGEINIVRLFGQHHFQHRTGPVALAVSLLAVSSLTVSSLTPQSINRKSNCLHTVHTWI